ncbi:MAG: hypothetical protein AB7N76_16385 [Planctomycetota bacterium]
MNDPRPQLASGVRRRVASRAVGQVALASVIALLGALWLTGRGEARAGTALVFGHAVGQAVCASWLLGALIGFDRDAAGVVGATLGLSFYRMLLATAALVGGAALWDLSPTPLVLGFIATRVWGHVVEGLALRDLVAAARSGTARAP